MKIQTKIAVCIILALVICSSTQFYINRSVVSSKIQELTGRKLDEIANSVTGFIKTGKLPERDLEHLLNKEIVIGKTGFVFVIDTKGKMVIHKKVQGENWIKKDFIKHIVDKKNGYHRYLSPKTGTYKVASFRYVEPKNWIVVASAFENEDLVGPLKEMEILSSIIVIPLIIFMVLVCIFSLRYLVMKPLGEVVDNMENIAEGEGDLSRRIKVKSKDELGELGSSFNRFQTKLVRIINEISDHSMLVDKASESMRKIAGNLSKGTDEISKRTSTISDSTNDVSNRMNSVSASVQQSETNISVIANAIEQLGKTIKEIRVRSSNAKNITDEAVKVSRETKSRITELGDAATEIGSFTGAITEISEQTNLLALNATIEAARAGESGKGFAVVAGEIKVLASQTNDAAKNINQMIESIQFSTDSSVETIDKIADIIDNCNELVTSMAKLVEEQSKTTGEITRNVMELLNGVGEVSSSVKTSVDFIGNVSEDLSAVNFSVLELAESGKEMADNSNEVANLAGQLRSLLGVFKT